MAKKKLLSPAYERKKVVVVDVTPQKEKCCLNCQYAYLMRSEKWNPIVAHCLKNNERNVAKAPLLKKNCGYIETKEVHPIHPMIDVRSFDITQLKSK